MLLYDTILLYVITCYCMSLYVIIPSYPTGITLDLPAAPRATSLSTWGQTRSLALTSSRRSLDVLLAALSTYARLNPATLKHDFLRGNLWLC
jgi:hypothetical protein